MEVRNFNVMGNQKIQCPCKRVNCARHGDCAACRKHHSTKKLLPTCERVQKKAFQIGKVPAILWGKKSDKLILAVHGNLSHKADIPVTLLAANTVWKGYQVLSFDLPGHGDRKKDSGPCTFKACIEDLKTVMEYARTRWKSISLFGNSMGAYFSLLAYSNEPVEKAWFLSPVVDMQRMVENMMAAFHITAKQLEREQVISTPTGQKLYWEDYDYVLQHPVETWSVPTDILYGSKDSMCEYETISTFVKRFPCSLEIVQDAEHYFHTPEQLMAFTDWLSKTTQQ